MNGLLRIKSTLQPHWVIHPSHVRRMTNQVVDLLENIGVELEEGVFACSPTSNPSHPTVIACRNIENTKDRPPDGVFLSSASDQATEEATWPGGQPPGARPVPSHPFRHLMDVILLPPPYNPPTRTFTRTSQKLWKHGRLHGAVHADTSLVTSTPPHRHS
jgi:hypothetical protein